MSWVLHAARRRESRNSYKVFVWNMKEITCRWEDTITMGRCELDSTCSRRAPVVVSSEHGTSLFVKQFALPRAELGHSPSISPARRCLLRSTNAGKADTCTGYEGYVTSPTCERSRDEVFPCHSRLFPAIPAPFVPASRCFLYNVPLGRCLSHNAERTGFKPRPSLARVAVGT
jgi:hypothetical protein